MKITVIFTCFNRKEKSIKCIRTLIEGNKEHDLSFIIVDDNSTDGTPEAIKALGVNAKIITGTGSYFWSGGMRIGVEDFLKNDLDSEYVVLVNDDVDFFPDVIDKMIKRSQDNFDAVIVGATCDSIGNLSYGAMKLTVPRKKDLYFQVKPSDEKIECDTFNCNCVVLNKKILQRVGNFDERFRHSLADLDYGFMLKSAGYTILSSSDYIGVCNKNSIEGTWRDITLSGRQRFKKKESIKGAPFAEWFYFMNKNFGLLLAVRYSVSPYIRILLGK